MRTLRRSLLAFVVSSSSFLLHPVAAAQCGSTVPSGTITVRVSAKMILGPTGQRPAGWGPTDMLTMLNDADTYLNANANIDLQIEPIVELLDPGIPAYLDTAGQLYSWWRSSLLYSPEMESAAQSDPVRFGWRPDAINLYVTDSLCNASGAAALPPGSACLSYLEEIILLSANFTPTVASRGPTLAHELMHWFDVYHTHGDGCPPHTNPGCSGTGGNASTGGDLVVDTPFDPFPTALSTLYGPAGSCPNPSALAALQNNLMSYQLSALPYSMTSTLTAGQVARARTRLWAARRYVVVGCPSPTITSISPSPTTGPGPTTITLTGSNLPISSNLVVQAGWPICTTNGTNPCGTLSLATCPAHATSSTATVNAAGTSITATFADPIPPGRHDVSVRDGNRVVAALVDGLTVHPYLETTPYPLNGTTFDLNAKTSVPSAPLIVLAGVHDRAGTTDPSVVGTFFLTLAPPLFVFGLSPCPAGTICDPTPILSDANRDWSVTTTTTVVAPGTNLILQVVEASSSGVLVSNPVIVTTP